MPNSKAFAKGALILTAPGKTLVIIPAHNEQGRIGRVIAGVGAALPEAGVLVVDDASTDRTRQEALGAGAAVITHGVNLGYGAGLESGYIYAAGKGYATVLQMDGDGQHPPDQLPLLLAPVLAGEADLVIGSRYLPESGPYRTPLMRRTGQRLFATALRVLTGRSFSDPTSGFQCLGPRALKLYTSGLFPYDYPDADMLLLGHYAGLRVEEVPVAMIQRNEGTSMHSGLKPVYYTVKMLLSMFIVMLGGRRWKRYV